MRRLRGSLRSALPIVTLLLVAVTATAPAATAAPTSPAPGTTPTTSVPTGAPTSPAAPSPSASASVTPSPTPSDRGIPADFLGQLQLLQAQFGQLQSELATAQETATTALAAYTATTTKLQQAVATAARAEKDKKSADAAVVLARQQVQGLVRASYVERVPRASAAVLLTSDVDDLDFVVTALSYLTDHGNDVYGQMQRAQDRAAQIVATREDALASAKALQATADTQRETALTAVGDVQTRHASYLTAVTALRESAAKAAGAAPLSPGDTKAYAEFLTELDKLGAGTQVGTTYVDGGPGLTPRPGTRWVRPVVKYTISSPYGLRGGEFHHGIDFADAAGTPIYAVGAGEVVAAGPSQGFGNWVVIDHGDGSFSIYGHMRVLATKVGATVRTGALIAYVGNEGESSGSHLHFEVRLGGYASGSQSTDPVLWLAQRGVTL